VVNGRLGADLTLTDKGRMLYALYGVRQAAEAQQALAPLLAATPGFQSLPPEQAWRMLLDRSAWDDGGHAGLRFENEPGYMGAMYNGLSRVLQAHQQGRLFDAAMLAEVHDAATQGVYQMRVVSELRGESGFREAAERTPPAGAAASSPHAQGGPAQMESRFEPGFRGPSTASFGLAPGSQVTRDGLKEFFDNQILYPEEQRGTMATLNERGVELARLHSPSGWDGKCRLKLGAPALSRAQNKAKVETIIAHYRQALPRAATPEAKLAKIANCVLRLEQSHPFEDGNARTNGFLVLNKLLLENGLSPAMFADPNHFDANSTAELVQQIRQGQQAFAHHCRAQP
jgi:fido (protein-threonine AMPylation protein)